MCNTSCIGFGENNLDHTNVAGKSVIEVGSYNVNGSLRAYIESLNPEKYLGVDLELGPCVDQVCLAEDLISTFGRDAFDVVVSTEMVEHVKNWQKVFHNLKGITKPGGLLLVTTRSQGFPLHGYPFDYWRYEVSDMETIFADFEILALEADQDDPGVLVFARKPDTFKERSLRAHKLFSIITGKTTSTRYIYAYESLRPIRSKVTEFASTLRRWGGRCRHYLKSPREIAGLVRRKTRKSELPTNDS